MTLVDFALTTVVTTFATAHYGSLRLTTFAKPKLLRFTLGTYRLPRGFSGSAFLTLRRTSPIVTLPFFITETTGVIVVALALTIAIAAEFDVGVVFSVETIDT